MKFQDVVLEIYCGPLEVMDLKSELQIFRIELRSDVFYISYILLI